MARILSKPGLRRHALFAPGRLADYPLPFRVFDSPRSNSSWTLALSSLVTNCFGKRQDKHLPKLIELLAARGPLAWAQYLATTRRALLAALRHSLASGDLVFSFGGIGATPDDHTRACAAAALDAPLAIHPEGWLLVEGRFGDEAYPHRINMVNIPGRQPADSQPGEPDAGL